MKFLKKKKKRIMVPLPPRSTTDKQKRRNTKERKCMRNPWVDGTILCWYDCDLGQKAARTVAGA